MDYPEPPGQRLPGHVTVLVIEGNAAARLQLVAMIESDPVLQVTAAVASPQAALEVMRRKRPDVVLMDQSAAGLGSIEGTRCIMQTLPVPIVLNATSDRASEAVFRAMEAGAVSCIDKPTDGLVSELDRLASHMRLTLKLMSEVKVVRHWARTAPAARLLRSNAATVPTAAVGRVVGIGASTGGPIVLQAILAGLPQPFDAPVLVVQHLARGFLQGMVDWLGQSTGMRVQVAVHGVSPQPGQVYMAPDGCQMTLGPQGAIHINRNPSPGLHQPSVSALFQSLAEVCGPWAIGVLLTGMGRDGAAELKLMKDRGATTIAQDRDSSTVHGMPGEAIALGGATLVLAADKIANAIASLVPSHPPVDIPLLP